MKKLIVLLALLLLASCQEEVASYDSLTPDERTAIYNMSSTKCVAESEEAFTNFKNSSNAIFTDDNYARGQGFQFTLKNGTTVFKTINIRVWKKTATASATEIYFLISDSLSNKDYFLRITKAENEAMIDDLKAAFCLRPAIYTSGLTSSSLTMTYNYSMAESSNTANYQDTYLMYFNELVQFATYRISRTKKITDSNNNQIGSTESYTPTFADQDKPFGAEEIDPDVKAKIYCTIQRRSPVLGWANKYGFIQGKNFQGFYDPTDTSSPLICETTKPGTWDLIP